MIALVRRQPQAAGDGRDHLLRRLRPVAAFQPGEVVGGHGAQLRHLLTTQTRGAPALPPAQPDVLRLQRRAPGAQERAARTGDGLDLQTATNHTGPFLLTNLLLEHVTDRVVHVTSQLHTQGKIDLADLDWRTRKYHGMAAYQASKLAVVLFSLELQRRLTASGSPVRSVLASPGIARTALAAHSRSNVVNRFKFLTNSPERGALSVLYAATEDVSGNAYVGPDGPGGLRGYPAVRRQGKAGLDETLAGRLWDATADLVGAVAR